MVCQRAGIFGLDYRYFVTARDFIKKGDKAVVYAQGIGFVATVEVAQNFYFDATPIGWTKGNKSGLFPYRFPLKILQSGRIPLSFSTDSNGEEAVHVKPNIIDQVSFIADKGRTWNIYIQVSVTAIPEEDFHFISRQLRDPFDIKPEINKNV